MQHKINNNKCFLSTKNYIGMISKRSRDTENYSNGYWKFSFAFTWIHYILKYIKIQIKWYNISQYYYVNVS